MRYAMSNEIKRSDMPNYEPPPFWTIDLGERWGRELGSIDSRLTRVENDILKLDAKIDKLDAKVDAKIDEVNGRLDKCLIAMNRMDERWASTRAVMFGLFVSVLAGIILLFFR